MAYLGDFALGATFDTKFCTVQATGAPTTLSASPVISAYPDNSTTQLTAGITLSVDFDSVTGLNNVRVVATGANGYLAGSNYQLVITTGTVNSVSAVGYVVGEFSIQARPPQISATGATQAVGVADAGTLQSATGTTAVIRSGASATDSVYNGHTLFIASGTGAGQSRLITGYVGSSKTATVDTWTTNPDNTSLYVMVATPPGSTVAPVPANAVQFGGQTVSASGTVTVPNGTIASTTSAVGSVTGAVGSVTGAVGSVTGNVGGNVTGNVGGSVGSVTGNIGGNVTGSVGSVTGAVGSVTAGVNLAGSAGIKKNTAKAAYMFLMTDSTTHAPATGLTVTATRSLDGAAFGACTNAVAEVSAGWYKISLAAGDLNGDTVALKFTATGADPLNIGLVTTP